MKRAWYAMRRSFGDLLFDNLNRVFLVLLCITIIYPFWTSVMMSFSPVDEATSLGLRLWISSWSTAAYRFAFSHYGNVGIAYANSAFRVVVGTVLTLVFTLMAAYPLSKKRIPGRNVFTIIILITMFFSGGLIPTYLWLRTLGLLDTRWVLILPTLTVGFHIIITRNFLMTIDAAYEEAAFIDGANYIQVLLRVMVPLSKPIIATIALWNAVRHWNAWFDAMIYIRAESKIVLQIVLRRLIQIYQVAESSGIEQWTDLEEVELPTEAVRAAVTLLTIGPIILLYPFLQRYFIKGIFIGSLKG